MWRSYEVGKKLKLDEISLAMEECDIFVKLSSPSNNCTVPERSNSGSTHSWYRRTFLNGIPFFFSMLKNGVFHSATH